MTTLILLPGMDGTGELFAPILRELPTYIKPRIIAYPTHEHLGYHELTSFVEEVLTEASNYVILGESFSGPIAITAAARYPARLRGLILACSFASTPLPTLAPLRHLVGFLPSPQRVLAPLSFALMGKYASPDRKTSRAALLAPNPASCGSCCH